MEIALTIVGLALVVVVGLVASYVPVVPDVTLSIALLSVGLVIFNTVMIGLLVSCDSSIGRHASAHSLEEHHPVIRAFEPGEAWRWCFVDQRTG